jgi:hypothetical protein
MARLKAYAATAEGAARIDALERMLAQPGARGLGRVCDPAIEGACRAFLHLMTGKAEHAVEAANLVRWALFSRYEQGAFWRHGYTLLGVGLAYDMCGETWSRSDRQFVYAYIEQHARQHAQRHDQDDILNTGDHFMFANPIEGFVYDDRQTDSVFARAGAMVASLAILNDPPECVLPPAEVSRLAPLKDFAPWYGVPVVEFESDVMPRRWLINGPFLRQEIDGAVAEQAGGYGAMRPEPGAAMSVEGVPLAWRPYVPAGHNGDSPRLDVRQCGRYFGMGQASSSGYTPASKVIDKWRQRFAGRQIPMSVLLYTVVTNDVERIVEALPNWRSPSLSSRMWINGRSVEDGAIFQLQPGYYSLVAEVPIYGTSSVQSPKLREYDLDMLRVARSIARRAAALAGPSLPENRVLLNATAMRRSVERWIEGNVSPDGWDPKGYPVLAPMLLAHRNVMGFDLSGGERVTDVLEWALRLRGHAAGANASEVLRLAHSVMPRSRQPYARWCLAGDGDTGEVGALDSILSFITMPGDAPKAQPRGVFHLVHNFSHSGRYLFNSGFDGARSLVAMVMTGAGDGSAPAALGGVALSGLGESWLGWRMPGDVWEREFTGLVPMELFPAAKGRVIHESRGEDGSGIVTLRQDALVRGSVRSWFDAEAGVINREVRIGRTPVRGAYTVRSVGVDYSGLCGAPMLVAVADRVQLARRREVAWRLALGGSGIPGIRPGPRTDERAEERSFRIAGRSGAGLDVNYVAPAEFEFRVKNDAEQFTGGVIDAVVHRRSTVDEQAARRSALAAKDAARIRETAHLGGRDEVDDHGARPVNVLELADNLLEEIKEDEEGPPPPVTFLVVMTLQQGSAPVVEAMDRGEFPSARIGRRLVRFDGTNVVFGVREQAASGPYVPVP